MPPEPNSQKRSHPLLRFLSWFAVVLILLCVAWSLWVTHEINRVAHEDEARPADAIAVFGAAEYAGRPSPIYHARLDHAVALYQRQIAPLVITLGGGSDRDSGKTEGGVGRDYLLANGVPLTDIVAETHSFNTSQQVEQLAHIASVRGINSIVVVSDPTHLFRIRELCREEGLDVYPSPRPPLGTIDEIDMAQRYAHEIVSYTAMRLGLPEAVLHHDAAGHPED